MGCRQGTNWDDDWHLANDNLLSLLLWAIIVLAVFIQFKFLPGKQAQVVLWAVP